MSANRDDGPLDPTSGKRLYRAEVTVVVYLLADSESAAEWDADGYASDALSDGNVSFVEVSPADRDGAEMDEWLGSAPYGGDRDDERTVAQIMDEVEVESEKQFVDPDQLALLSADGPLAATGATTE